MKIPKIKPIATISDTSTEKTKLSKLISYTISLLGSLLQWSLLATLLIGLFTVYTDNQDFLKFTVDKGFLAFQNQGIQCARLGQITLDSQNKDLLNSYYDTLDTLNSDILDAMHPAGAGPKPSNISKSLELKVQDLEQKIISLNSQNAKAFEAFQECTNSMLIQANTTASLLGLEKNQLCPIQKSYYLQLNQIKNQKAKSLSGIGANSIESFYLGNNPTEDFWNNIQNDTGNIHSQLFIYKQQLQPQEDEINLANAYFDRMKTILLIQMNLIHHQTLPMILKSIFVSDKENENELKSALQENLNGHPNTFSDNCK